MAIHIGKPSITLKKILEVVSEFDILYHYFGINSLPKLIKSPLRPDNHPSFGIYSPGGNKVYWTDLANRDKGGIFDLLMRYWGMSYNEVLTKIWEDLPNFSSKKPLISKLTAKGAPMPVKISHTELECKVRDWKEHDIEYWNSFGISLEWLKYADIYPISHKIIIKDGKRYVFGADKYAYAYVERKEGKITLKIYQPFNKDGYKWTNKHDMSVISLWTKVPETGDRICICSSMKDALCLWSNTGIPALSIQGEGYNMSDTAVSELKRRYTKVYTLLDNDEAGLKDGLKLSEATGFTNLVLPNIAGCKDISDIYKHLQNRQEFRKIILDLFERN
jgi:hypothetical protein